MADITGTNGNNTYLITQAANFSIDGLAGIDTIDFGTDPQGNYEITLGRDGLVHVDSLSGASQVLRLVLKNFEVLLFSSGREKVDLTTFFGDTVPPGVLATSPGGAAVAADTNLVWTFSEPVVKGSGSITIKDSAGALLATYDVASSPDVIVSGSTLTLNPSTDLPFGGSLRVELSAGSVKDNSGNALASAAAFSFSTAADPRYTGTAGNDVFTATPGPHAVTGAGGIDLLVLGQPRSAYTVQHLASVAGLAFKVDGGAPAASFTLADVERLQFSDTKLALDLSGRAGQTAKILGAVFGAAAVGNAEYAGIGLQLLDGGMSYEALMSLALGVVLGPNPSHGAVVDLLWANVIGGTPDAASRATFVGLLDNGTYTPASLGVLAADTPQNAERIHLVGLADTGLAYIG